MDTTSLKETEPAASLPSDVNPDQGGRSAVELAWSDWRISFAVSTVVVAGFGLISVWLIPRGPITTAETLISMGSALAVGAVAGLVTGNRWVLLTTPLVFAIVFEIGRIGIVGPTVDSVNLGSFLGVVAFVLGRVLHGLVVLAPLTLGSVYGVWLARRFGNETASSIGSFGWTVTWLATIGLVVLAGFIARPASTAPIVGPDGQSLPGSIAELAFVPLGGHDQALMIRGRDVDKPVLLYLAGGPGGTDIGAMRRDVTLEQEFVVVTWDQRGAGKSYAALDPTDTFTLEQLTSDTIELTDYLRNRFDEDKIYLVGQSWGSTLGLLAVQQRPDLYHAVVGVGQMVSQRETDIMFWEDTMAWAEVNGKANLAASLRDSGPPPYDDIYDYDPVVSNEHSWNSYPGLDLSHEMPGSLFVPEYSFMDRVNAFKGFLDTNGTMYSQLQDIDFRRDVPALSVPYYMVLGEHEARGRAVLATEWYDKLDAPSKARFIFEGSGHRPNFDRPGEFADVMRTVHANTSDSSP